MRFRQHILMKKSGGGPYLWLNKIWIQPSTRQKRKKLWYMQYMWFPISVTGFWTFFENYPPIVGMFQYCECLRGNFFTFKIKFYCWALLLVDHLVTSVIDNIWHKFVSWQTGLMFLEHHLEWHGRFWCAF